MQENKPQNEYFVTSNAHISTHEEKDTALSLVVISGEIIRITYHDPETLFTVAKLRPHKESTLPKHLSYDQRHEIALVGRIPHIQVGHTIYSSGKWVNDPRHGAQFQVENLRYQLPKDIDSIEKLLASGFLKGVGPKTAHKIVQTFKEETFDILQNQPTRLHEIKGLSQHKIEQIKEAWEFHTVHQEVVMLLLSWGLTHNQASKTLRKWQTETLATVKSNPYLLAQEIQGIGFTLADNIAKTLGFTSESPERIESAALFFLWEVTAEGHTCYPLKTFTEETAQKLHISAQAVEEKILELFEEKKIAFFIKDGATYISPPRLAAMEKAISQDIYRLITQPQSIRDVHAEKAVEWAEKTLGMSFALGQKQALITSLMHKVSIITGGPGTGKSTITKALLAILSKITKKITLAAPTGRAAKRLIEITHTHSHTIHRLLKFDPISGKFQHNRTNPIQSDVFIIDETSMVDTMLMFSFLQAVPDSAKVIFVGDVNQLPSIGPGCVLKDFIQSQKIAVSRLDEIFRQAKRSKIIENAHRVNNGQMPWLKNFPGSDFLFIPATEAQDVRKAVFELVTKTIPEQYGFNPKQDVQILAPMRKGICGIDQQNADLQAYFSKGITDIASPLTKETKKVFFTVGDKIIQLKNNYSKEVFNGDIGFIRQIDHEANNVLHIQMEDRHIVYEPTEIDEITLAWAVSIHKYQGSEAPCVVIPLHTQHFKLLSRNLVYTAITRGKKLVIVVGSLKALAIALKNTTGEDRWTYLQENLCQVFK